MSISKATRERTKVINAYRRLFSTDDGKIVLHDLINAFILPDGEGRDPYETYKNIGARQAVLRILQTTKLSEEQITQMIEQMYGKPYGELYE